MDALRRRIVQSGVKRCRILAKLAAALWLLGCLGMTDRLEMGGGGDVLVFKNGRNHITVRKSV